MHTTIRLFSLLGMCLCLSVCGGEEKRHSPAVPASALAVSLGEATLQPLQRSIVVSGPVAAYEEMQLGVEMGGHRVTALRVEVGQSVHRGQVLLELDRRSVDAELAQAEA